MDKASQKSIFFEYDDLKTYSLPDTILVRLRSGLPQSSKLEHNAGVRFANDLAFEAESGKRNAKRLPIAYVWDREAEYLVIESDSGEIRACGPDGGKSVFVNSDLNALLDCLEAYRQFQNRRPPEPEPLILNEEEMRLKLEAFRRGEIKPKRTAAEAALLEAEDRRELKALTDFLRQRDPECLKRGGAWWKTVIEQVNDGLI